MKTREALSTLLGKMLASSGEFENSHLSLWKTVLQLSSDRAQALEKILKLQFSHLVDLHHFNVSGHDLNPRLNKPQDFVEVTDLDDGSCQLSMTFRIRREIFSTLFNSLQQVGIGLSQDEDDKNGFYVTASYTFTNDDNWR